MYKYNRLYVSVSLRVPHIFDLHIATRIHATTIIISITLFIYYKFTITKCVFAKYLFNKIIIDLLRSNLNRYTFIIVREVRMKLSSQVFKV